MSDMRTWLFDLGNSRLKCAPLTDDTADVIRDADVIETTHDGERFAAEWIERLPARIDHAIVASVARPALTARLLDGLTQRCGRIALARTQRTCDGISIAYAEPRRLGVDRFLAMLAAHAREASPWLIVGVGTALTIDLLDADGRHRGGRIAPAPTLMREALHARAPHLPVAGGAYAEFADDTADALASGCEGAALALIERSIAMGATQLGVRLRVLLHGGGANALHAQLDGAAIAPTLVLEGLATWARIVAPA